MTTPLNRREFLRLVGLVSTGSFLTACAPTYARLADSVENIQAGEYEEISGLSPADSRTGFRALNRFTYGPNLNERHNAARNGIQAWIEEQLAPETISDAACDIRLRRFTTLTMNANDLFDLSDKLFDEQDRLRVPDELRQATLLRQIYSRRQLYEAIVEFWTDHFNISVDKGNCFYLKTVDDRSVIRPHALGSFTDLLRASAHSPAMLVYLDNQANHQAAPNENYARELLELHTLGVNGGYTQGDVIAMARCLTGWTVKEHFWRGNFVYKANDHDLSPKIILGSPVIAKGQGEAEEVIDRLASHENTANFISWKLARRFIADDPPDELVKRGAAAFQKSRGDLRQVLHSILLDGMAYMQPKYKRPVNYLISALRILDARVEHAESLLEHLSRMGQLSFAWPTPDGYPDRSEAWQGNLLPRWQFAADLTQGSLPGVHIDLVQLLPAAKGKEPAALLEELSLLLLGESLNADMRRLLLDALTTNQGDISEWISLAAAVLLASPEFQWH